MARSENLTSFRLVSGGNEFTLQVAACFLINLNLTDTFNHALYAVNVASTATPGHCATFSKRSSHLSQKRHHWIL